MTSRNDLARNDLAETWSTDMSFDLGDVDLDRITDLTDGLGGDVLPAGAVTDVVGGLTADLSGGDDTDFGAGLVGDLTGTAGLADGPVGSIAAELDGVVQVSDDAVSVDAGAALDLAAGELDTIDLDGLNLDGLDLDGLNLDGLDLDGVTDAQTLPALA